MLRAISFGLLAFGIVLIIFGFGAQDSFHSKASEFFTGSPSDATVWYLSLGIASLVAGLIGLASSVRRV
ncbi:MAG: DUF3185 family protein [Planctomycetota bacterium]|nr:MAG: DUF3185 family protein [Planctomycetota bacterium]